jgi:hypothetical protein
MYHLVISVHELCMYHNGLVDVFSGGCFETKQEAEETAQQKINDTKNDIQRLMNVEREGHVNDLYHFEHFVFELK